MNVKQLYIGVYMAKYSATSALSGAASGAATGSVFGPVGTAAGGIIGGIAGLFGSKKKKKKPKRISTLDPQQQALYNDYVGSIRGEGPFNDLYNYDAEGANQNFDQNVSRPAYRNFQENIIPGITGAYRQKNLMNSSYSADALAKEGRNVQENLDALRSNMQFQGQQNAQANKQNAINNILGTKTFDYQQPQAPGGGIDEILNKVAPQAGEWFANYLNKGNQSGSGMNILNNYSNNISNAAR